MGKGNGQQKLQYLRLQSYLNPTKLMPISKGKSLLLTIGILLSLTLLSHQTLSVYNLQALGQSSKALEGIQYSIANFGFVPYGKTMISHLISSPNFSDECNIVSTASNDYENSFMLIPRGACPFVTKAINAQKLGAHLVIIMDDEKHDGSIIMADNGYGYKVKIPVIFIGYESGQLLKTLILDNKNNQIIMKIIFDNKKTEKVDVAFWLQSSNRHVYKLVSDFKEYHKNIRDHLNFKLVYSNIPCKDCPKTDCFYEGKYCAQNLVHDSQAATGQDILTQQIREEIVFQSYPDLWWKFMKYVGDQCGPIAELKQCSKAGMNKLGIEATKIESAVQKSFELADNTYLKKNSQVLLNSGVNRFPSVSLNGIKVLGSLNAEFIFDDICNTLISPPDSCKKYLADEEYFTTQVTNEWSTVLLVIIIGIIIFSIIFVAYRRYMKRKISGEMQSRVDDMVSKYIEFYSERNGRK